MTIYKCHRDNAVTNPARDHEKEIKRNRIDPDSTRGYLDVNSMFFERYGRQMDVKIMLCAYYIEGFFLKGGVVKCG